GGLVYANLATTPLASVEHELHGVFAVDTRIAIPPHTPPMGYETDRRCSFSDDATIVAMTGHYHQRGDQFTVDWVGDRQGAETAYEQIYLQNSWDSPTFTVFPMSPKPMTIYAGFQGLRFHCWFHNDSDITIGFGGHAEVQEHCNLFFQYFMANP